MKKLSFLVIIGTAVATGCSGPDKKTDQKEVTGTDTVVASGVRCYNYMQNEDTVAIRLTRTGDSVMGIMTYHLKEKDRNEGTLQGIMKGNVLLADYIFNSEGKQSTRQVAFRMDGNTLIEGNGDIDTRNDRSYFKNPDSLQFNSIIKLVQSDCK